MLCTSLANAAATPFCSIQSASQYLNECNYWRDQTACSSFSNLADEISYAGPTWTPNQNDCSSHSVEQISTPKGQSPLPFVTPCPPMGVVRASTTSSSRTPAQVLCISARRSIPNANHSPFTKRLVTSTEDSLSMVAVTIALRRHHLLFDSGHFCRVLSAP